MNKKIQLLLICAVFISPFIAASFLYQARSDVSLQTKNNGLLIQPPIATSDILTNPKRHWRLALINGSSCEATCQQQLYLIRQIRTSLGKYQQRLDYLLLSPAKPLSDVATLALHPDLQQVQLSTNQIQQLQQQINQPDQSTQLVLIDPLGNLLMQWPLNSQHLPNPEQPVSKDSQQKAKGIISDIKHLLKISRIG